MEPMDGAPIINPVSQSTNIPSSAQRQVQQIDGAIRLLKMQHDAIMTSVRQTESAPRHRQNTALNISSDIIPNQFPRIMLPDSRQSSSFAETVPTPWLNRQMSFNSHFDLPRPMAPFNVAALEATSSSTPAALQTTQRHHLLPGTPLIPQPPLPTYFSGACTFAPPFNAVSCGIEQHQAAATCGGPVDGGEGDQRGRPPQHNRGSPVLTAEVSNTPTMASIVLALTPLLLLARQDARAIFRQRPADGSVDRRLSGVIAAAHGVTAKTVRDIW
jgi:hypothetical protein